MNRCPNCGDFIDDPFFMITGQGICSRCFIIVDITMPPKPVEREEQATNEDDGETY